ncbi:MAG: hypothetical protein V1696_00615 [Candidatus Jorgensenbacteria bacterium]
MARVNKTQFPAKLREEVRERLRRLLHGTTSGDELFRALAKILTTTELLLIEKRLAVPILLARGMSYREIGRTIDIGPAAISFMKHGLTRKPRTPRQYSPLRTPRKKGHILLSPPPMGRGRWRWLNDL